MHRTRHTVHLIHCSETPRCSARVVGLAGPLSGLYWRITWTCDHQPVYHHHGPWRDHLFHDRPTCASSRCRCSRPERGQFKVPFSQCRCRILLIDYRWGSMGSDDTATATSGGPRVIGVFDGSGAPSGPNYLLFSDVDRLVISLRNRSEVG